MALHEYTRRIPVLVSFLVCSLVLNSQRATAQQYAGGPPDPARYQLRASAAYPMGVGPSASMRILHQISIEAGVGLLPIAFCGTAGLNLHLTSSSELDPALSFLGTYMIRKGENAYSGTLAYSLLSSRATSLHSYGRIGLSALFLDGKIYPSPVLELGIAYGIR
jgi:hypothetical protein